MDEVMKSTKRRPSGNWGGLRSQERRTARARVLEDDHIERVFEHIRTTSNSPASDELKFAFSVFAGLRACEIAGMTLEAVVDADGRIGRHIIVSRQSAKGGRERIIPMHPRIRDALVRFREAHPAIRNLSFSARRGHVRHQNASAIKSWFLLLYQQVGLQGCSSHSGRRTFITRLARLANLHGNSLHDVQLLAGHARLQTTAHYIDPSDNLAGLVAAFGGPNVAKSKFNNQGENA